MLDRDKITTFLSNIFKVKFDLSQKIEKYSSDVDNIFFRENKQPK